MNLVTGGGEIDWGGWKKGVMGMGEGILND